MPKLKINEHIKRALKRCVTIDFYHAMVFFALWTFSVLCGNILLYCCKLDLFVLKNDSSGELVINAEQEK